jgi:hypothetical protein
MTYYMTCQNAYGQRALYRCYRTSAGYTAVFVGWVSDAQHDAD